MALIRSSFDLLDVELASLSTIPCLEKSRGMISREERGHQVFGQKCSKFVLRHSWTRLALRAGTESQVKHTVMLGKSLSSSDFIPP